MTLDEAIKHCKEISSTCKNIQCAADHAQLAEWLTELKQIKEST